MRLTPPKTPGPYGMEPTFRLDMLSSDELAGQGVTLLPAATPPAVNQGITLDGASQYARVLLAQYTAAFEGGYPGGISIYCEFSPDFNYTEAANRALWDGVAPNRYITYKDSTGPNYYIHVYAGATTLVASVPAANYGPLWRVGQKNKLAACLISGANNVYFNGSLVFSGAVAWSRLLPGYIDIGATGALGINFFDGIISDFRIYSRQLTVAEATELTTIT